MTKWRRILAAVLIAPLLLAGLPARAQMLQAIVNGASPSRWMLFGQRGHIFAGADAVIGSNNYGASRILFSTAAWPVTSIKVYYPNWYGGNTITPYEGTPGSSLYIDGAVVETVANTTFATLKFGASPTITLADGADVWSDTLVFSTPIPANSTFWIRTAFHRANTTDNTFGQYAANGNTASGATGNGEGLISGTSTEVAHLSGSFTVSNTLNVYGPAMLAGLGWNGDPVILMAGDSQQYGYVDNTRGDTRGNIGMGRGLDNTTSGAKRIAYANFAIPGAGPTHDGFSTKGNYGYRIGAIAPIITLNGGALPFTTLWSEEGGADMANTLAPFVTIMQAWWTFLRATWPAAWLVQSTMSPSTTSTDTWTTLANQTASQAAYVYPTGSAWVFNSNLLAGDYTSIGASGFVDAVFDTNTFVAVAGAYIVPGFSDTLAAAASSGQAVISLNNSPPLYDNLVLNQGQADAEGKATQYVKSITGTGPYSTTMVLNLTNNHLISEPVLDAVTFDGVHVAEYGYLTYMNPAIDAGKSAFR